VDILHYFYQGDVKRYLTYLEGHYTTAAIKQIDIGFTKLQVPGIKHFSRGVFALSMTTGDEVKQILYLLPIAMEGAAVKDEIIRVAVAMNTYQMIAREHRYTVRSHTSGTGNNILSVLMNSFLQSQRLVDLGNAAKEIEDALALSGLKEQCKSEFNLLKAHETGQLPLYVMLFEEAIAMSAEVGENAHKDFVSLNYAHTNRVNPLRDMTKYHNIRMGARYIESLNLPEQGDDEDEDGDEDGDGNGNGNGNGNGDDSDMDDNVDDDNVLDGLPVPAGKQWKLTWRPLLEFFVADIPQDLFQQRPGLAVLPDALMAFLNALPQSENAEPHVVTAAEVGNIEVWLPWVSSLEKK